MKEEISQVVITAGVYTTKTPKGIATVIAGKDVTFDQIRHALVKLMRTA